MDWGNAIVRSKTVDASGVVTGIEMDLHLEGDFKKTEKKITWLAQKSDAQTLVPITLLDHDYLITKMKLEENDVASDFYTAQTEFREAAVSDSNVNSLTKGDVIQFERKGYFIFDGKGDDGRLEFIRIPDGRAANLASKAGAAAAAAATSSSGASAGGPVTTMYKVDAIYGEDVKPDTGGLKMYKIDPIYSS
jgi:glutamyl-tRNA synthetase